ncbi:hypothetical protein [Chryseobacterium sp. MP_3.2]|uniref:hypothetical protein n=1 Tax=Chryseobacterium sp. MP_3.2 TaxID=3071712 RepID=UPI002E069B57|nr:hypothetical protein [Chryseobacterium sp. MP_3.2]
MNDLATKGTEAKKVTSATEPIGNIANSKQTQDKQKSAIQEKKEALAKILEPVTAEQRIRNGENFLKIAEKHRFLTEKEDDLNSFMIGRDGLKEKVQISNDNGQIFEISNSVVIDEVLNLCSEKLSHLVSESKEQILTFHI